MLFFFLIKNLARKCWCSPVPGQRRSYSAWRPALVCSSAGPDLSFSSNRWSSAPFANNFPASVPQRNKAQLRTLYSKKNGFFREICRENVKKIKEKIRKFWKYANNLPWLFQRGYRTGIWKEALSEAFPAFSASRRENRTFARWFARNLP